MARGSNLTQIDDSSLLYVLRELNPINGHAASCNGLLDVKHHNSVCFAQQRSHCLPNRR
ncbi:proteasome subunit beta type-2-A-like [Pyrus ussuriensis x Pyrus communis]|uniref:Proteasome subunit beta type-2-A-like n=1 Tax=Pyrus ussuriensis x Pyrus communis TaxID=2448454 RepID=A0A5N5GCC1_9ROSA|nr:proteasome subunit beta type-2-A-like [Pyrus ussuriensis x Pyrus communis]